MADNKIEVLDRIVKRQNELETILKQKKAQRDQLHQQLVSQYGEDYPAQYQKVVEKLTAWEKTNVINAVAS